MKIKTFIHEDPQELDRIVNEYEEAHDIRASQAMTYKNSEGEVRHKIVTFEYVKK